MRFQKPEYERSRDAGDYSHEGTTAILVSWKAGGSPVWRGQLVGEGSPLPSPTRRDVCSFTVHAYYSRLNIKCNRPVHSARAIAG